MDFDTKAVMTPTNVADAAGLYYVDHPSLKWAAAKLSYKVGNSAPKAVQADNHYIGRITKTASGKAYQQICILKPSSKAINLSNGTVIIKDYTTCSFWNPELSKTDSVPLGGAVDILTC